MLDIKLSFKPVVGRRGDKSSIFVIGFLRVGEGRCEKGLTMIFRPQPCAGARDRRAGTRKGDNKYKTCPYTHDAARTPELDTGMKLGGVGQEGYLL